jgi:replication factor A1
MKVKGLKAKSSVDEITVQIIGKEEPRAFAGPRGNGRVCNCIAKDEDDAEITLTLWNEDIDKFKEQDIVKLTGGWVSEFKGKLQLSAGKGGKMEVIKE